jgi:hypothetical protein
MDLRRLVSLFLAALLVAVLPVSLAASPIAAMQPVAHTASPCPHDHASSGGPHRPDSHTGQAAALCHQHCAPAVIPSVLHTPRPGLALPAMAAPAFAVAPWIAGIDPPPPRWRT